MYTISDYRWNASMFLIPPPSPNAGGIFYSVLFEQRIRRSDAAVASLLCCADGITWIVKDRMNSLEHYYIDHSYRELKLQQIERIGRNGNESCSSLYTQHICTLEHMRSDRGRERESDRASLANCQTKTNQLFPVCNTCIVVVVWCYKSLRWDRVENGRHTIVFVCGHIMAFLWQTRKRTPARTRSNHFGHIE